MDKAAETSLSKAAEETLPASPSAVETVPKEKENIEDILMRTSRNEVIQKAGPEVVRYLPSEDRNAFLLPDSRLRPDERVWQKVFVALPYLVFACMLVVPLMLVRSNLPLLQKRAEDEREQAAERAANFIERTVPRFEVVRFSQMPDVLERPFPTLLLLFDSRVFGCKVFLPALRDLESALRAAKIPVSIAALDLAASPRPPDDFLWEYPPALGPHMQIVLPQARDGEAGIVDYDGFWSATAIAEAARSTAGPYMPAVPADELRRLDSGIETLRDAFFELLFVEEVPPQTARPSRLRSVLGAKGPSPEEVAAERAAALAKAEQQVDLTGGLDAAIASCKQALEQLRAGGQA